MGDEDGEGEGPHLSLTPPLGSVWEGKVDPCRSGRGGRWGRYSPDSRSLEVFLPTDPDGVGLRRPWTRFL